MRLKAALLFWKRLHEILAHVMLKIRPRNPLACIIYNPRKEFSKPDAILFFAGTLCWRQRNFRSRLDHRRRSQVRLADVARLQPHFLGHHSYQVELAAPCPAAERTIPARL